MLKILYKDGSEDDLQGKVKFYEGSQPALCKYDFSIEGREKYSYDNLKLVYDDDTKEFVYFTYCSYGFHEGYDKYQEFYKQSKRELKLVSKFKSLIEEYGEHISLKDLSDWLVFNENEIKNIYRNCKEGEY